MASCYLDSTLDAFLVLMRGENVGKMIVKLWRLGRRPTAMARRPPRTLSVALFEDFVIVH